MGSLILIIIALLFYLIPAIIASYRWHNNRDAIFVLNLALGWTFLGWIIAMIWAFTNDVHPSRKK